MIGGKHGADPFLISSSVAPHHTSSVLHPDILSPKIKHHNCVHNFLLNLRNHMWNFWGINLTTHPYLVTRLRMSGAIILLPYAPLGSEQGQFYHIKFSIVNDHQHVFATLVW